MSKQPISKEALYRMLSRELKRLRAADCARCDAVMPRRVGDHEWACHIPPCELGCHHKLDFLTRVYSQQYRLRDLSDTNG